MRSRNDKLNSLRELNVPVFHKLQRWKENCISLNELLFYLISGIVRNRCLPAYFFGLRQEMCTVYNDKEYIKDMKIALSMFTGPQLA